MMAADIPMLDFCSRTSYFLCIIQIFYSSPFYCVEKLSKYVYIPCSWHLFDRWPCSPLVPITFCWQLLVLLLSEYETYCVFFLLKREKQDNMIHWQLTTFEKKSLIYMKWCYLVLGCQCDFQSSFSAIYNLCENFMTLTARFCHRCW